MALKKTLSDFMVKEEVECLLIQARVPMEIGSAVRQILYEKKLSWSEFMTAACQKYLEEIKPEKAGKKS